ncbi:MAG: hypothetical protein M3348_10770 [Acidobacteriota bacterium]|nr:hypothetical protein [Acidobacteriota bacterium]
MSFLFCCLALPVARPYSVRAAGADSDLHFLTADPNVADYWPCWSPDGKTILFSRSADKGETWALFAVPTSGGQARRVSPASLPVSATRPNWSAKNNLIAFTGESADGSATVWLINPDGTHPRQFVARGLSNKVFYPSWYPDGERLAVVDFGAGDVGVIKQVNLKTGVATPLTDPRQVLAGMPSVSPDGKWIAFAGQKNQGQAYDQTKNSIWLVGTTGEPRALEQSTGRTPAWSGDGRWLAFESDRGSPDHLYAVFVIERSGGGLKQVTPYGLNANHPVWSPDGKSLVFSARHAEGQKAPGIAIVQRPKLGHV